MARRTKALELTEADKQEIVQLYEGGMKQVDLAARFGVSQVRISQILRAQGVKTRQGAEGNPPKFDVAEAVRLYQTGLSEYEVAKLVGVAQGAVSRHLRRRIETRSKTAHLQVYKGFNRDFFATVDGLRAYWAGFIAADGCVKQGRNVVVFGLQRSDREILDKLARAAQLPHPIFEYQNSKGRDCIGLSVCCREWVRDLDGIYNITPKKAKTLRPPNLITAESKWAFARGYFDGDGHANKDGANLQITSGSKPFMKWLIRDLFQAHHSIYDHNGSWGCRVSGSVFRRVVRKLYEGSTEETRLARKYERFRKAGRFEPEK